MSYMSHFLVDTIVYWDKPEADFNGNYTFTAPIEIKCCVKEVFKDYVLENGETFVSKAEILTDNPTMRAEHGSAGRKRVEELYDNKVVTQAWVEYYRALFD